MNMDKVNKMPVLFVGHGSPMNAIEENEYTRGWREIAAKIPNPAAILAISTHWFTEGSRLADAAKPRTIYDMYGFPDELYRVKYSAPGAPDLARETQKMINRDVRMDNTWGIDHGAWSVLHRMYPAADIPVYQLSVDRRANAETHFQIGRELDRLREKGVLIFGSGNVVHNLGKISWGMAGGYPWADEFDRYIQAKVADRQFGDVINYKSAGKSAELAFVTPEHFYPLLYVLGAARPDDKLTVFNDSCTLGAISMTCYLFD